MDAKLPKILSDLSFTLDGQILQFYPIKNSPSIFHLALRQEEYQGYGLFVDFEQNFAEVKDSHSIHRYRNGQTTFFTHWDESTPESFDAPPFIEWIRSKMLKDIDRILSWHIDRIHSEYKIDENIDRYHTMCSEFAQPPKFYMTHHNESSALFLSIGAIHRCNKTNFIQETDQKAFAGLINKCRQSKDPNNELCGDVLSIVINLLEQIPQNLSEYYEEQTRKIYQYEPDELGPRSIQILGERICGYGKTERIIHHKYLSSLCSNPMLCHSAAAMMSDLPDESELYIRKGLNMDSENISLLIFAESFFLQRDEPLILKDIRSRIEALEVPTPLDSFATVQGWINRYTQLCNDFQYFKPKTNPTVTVPELLEMEAKLNHHWIELLSNTNSLLQSSLEEELCSQNRFLTSGSASIVGWLRNQGRYQEIVDHMMPLVDQLELCRLRNKTNNRGFETMIGNGLSGFLDSQEPKHIKQAIVLIDAIETVVTEWQHMSSLYALACVASRANQSQRALKYIKQILEQGRSIQDMVSDPDFKNMLNNQKFKQLLLESH